ncbi:hypothetical protein, partial [Neisseria sicca]|uniref:hypothetical protein n=1 Tax=Neisseria sicca TaxID=490 RepID=UPI001C99B3B0
MKGEGERGKKGVEVGKVEEKVGGFEGEVWGEQMEKWVGEWMERLYGEFEREGVGSGCMAEVDKG